jgi:hypothetical protein
MRKVIRASVLVLALTIPAFAGEIPNNLKGNIPNNETLSGEMQNGVAGEIPNNITGEIPYGATSQPLIDALLALLSLI